MGQGVVSCPIPIGPVQKESPREPSLSSPKSEQMSRGRKEPLSTLPVAVMVMETSLRLRSADGLRIHAKDKILLSSNALLQGHAEIDTTTGTPTYFALLARHFYPRLSANIGVGIHLPLHNLNASDTPAPAYTLRGKKAISFTTSGLLGINLKGRLLADKHFNPTIATAAIEFAWTILDFTKGQDVRLKLGYHLQHKMPYFQLRENNWTLNGYMDGKWDVRFDM